MKKGKKAKFNDYTFWLNGGMLYEESHSTNERIAQVTLSMLDENMWELL